MKQGVLKWLNYYSVYLWQVLLSLAFGLALCFNPVNASVTGGYSIVYDCDGALNYIRERVEYLTGYLEDRGCININSRLPVPNGKVHNYNLTEVSNYQTWVTAEADPNIPGSCSNNQYMPLGSVYLSIPVAATCNIVSAVQACPQGATLLQPGGFLGTLDLYISPAEHWGFRPECDCGVYEDGRVKDVGLQWWLCGSEHATSDFVCLNNSLACETVCGGVDKVAYTQCSEKHTYDGYSFPPVCQCKVSAEPADCDFVTGDGCATYDKQRQQLTAIQKIELEIGRGTLHYSGIDGVLRKNDGTYTDIKTLLTQIAASPGIVSAGGGGIGSGTGEEQPEPIWTPPAPPATNAVLTREQQLDNEIAAKKLELSQASQTVKQGLLAKMSLSNAPVGVGGLPCWSNLPLYAGKTFSICFSDWEEHLNLLPHVIYTAALILAAFFVVRKKV
jgi:hypothetical protein